MFSTQANGAGRAAPQPSYAAAPAAEIELSKPVAGHQGQITRVALREPTAADWIECGEISRVIVHRQSGDEPEKAEVVSEPRALLAWACRLSGIDAVVLGQLALGDMRKVVTEVRRVIAGADAGN